LGPAIWWVRRDLRLHDNPALEDALRSTGLVLPVYVHAPDEEGEWAAGAASRWWLHHSLEALRAACRARGGELVIRRGATAEVLARLARRTGAGLVVHNRLHEPAARGQQERVERLLGNAGIEVRAHRGTLLHEPDAVRTTAGNGYRVFTPFARRLATQGPGVRPLGAPRRLPAPEPLPEAGRLGALDLLPRPDRAGGLCGAWLPGEAGALARLRAFTRDGLHAYRESRDPPGSPGTSRLSPHLHFGELSPRRLWWRTRGNGDGASAFRRQLLWREFAHHVLHHWPRTPDEPLDAGFRDFPWRGGHGALLAAWRRAETGFPLVDAGMRELWQCGWMHNRVRMVAASLLVKNIRAPWQEGARWFWDTLVDADLADNTLGWQWAGGCGADAAPYFRVFNPVRQGERFDPAGTYVRRWLPELAGVPAPRLHAPWTLSAREQRACGVIIGRDYPAPVVDLRASREEALAAFARLRSAVRHRRR